MNLTNIEVSLLVSQDRRRLFVIPWLRDRMNMRFHRKPRLPTHNDRTAKTIGNVVVVNRKFIAAVIFLFQFKT
jgi:hypothetical protein